MIKGLSWADGNMGEYPDDDGVEYKPEIHSRDVAVQ